MLNANSAQLNFSTYAMIAATHFYCRFSNELIPKIFSFLVNLSYGKQHSKSIIGIPKIIQLCDGLMASGQPPVTHCIPALGPVVEDIFLHRSKSNTADYQELETTREVLFAMLLRLLEYREVIELVVTILNESKYCNDNSEKWHRWSKQVADVFLPMLKRNRIAVDDSASLMAVRRLVSVLNPSIFKPLNDVLIMLFDEPPAGDSSAAVVNRWLSKILTLLLVISHTKEELLLVKIMEMQSEFMPHSIFRNVSTVVDPLHVTNNTAVFSGIDPKIIFVRFFFRVVAVAADRTRGMPTESFLFDLLSTFLTFSLHLLQTGMSLFIKTDIFHNKLCDCFGLGSHCKITNTVIAILNGEIDLGGDEPIPLEEINAHFLNLAPNFPTLTFQWCCLLTLFNYSDRLFWSAVLQVTGTYGIIRNMYGEYDCTEFCDSSLIFQHIR